MMNVIRPHIRRAWRYWPAVAATAAAAMLAAAHAFERLGGLDPCALCLRQREIYWAVLAVAAAGAWFWAREPGGRTARAVETVLGAAFLTGMIVAAYHAGVEWKWWPGPATCAAGTGGPITAADIAAALSGPQKVVACDDAAWRDPVVNLSMAGWNTLISAGLAAASFTAALRGSDSVGDAHV
jgi:disulfide bond formation protein DsbB